MTCDSFLGEYPVEVINNGVDTQSFFPQNEKLKSRIDIEGKKMLLAVASKFERRKGIEFLLQLPHLLCDDEALVLVGLDERQKRIFATISISFRTIIYYMY